MLSALALALAATLVQQQDVQIQASLSDDRIAVGASTMLQISVEASGGRPEEIELPVLPTSLSIISSRDYQQTQLSLPGGRTTIVRRDVVLRAHREGLFTIPPAIVRLDDGTVLRTRPLTLRVVATAPGVRAMPGPVQPGGRAVGAAAGELRVTLAPDTAWLGEPVLLRMTAVIPEVQRTHRGRTPTFEPPSAPGFWVQEVEDRGAIGVRAFGDAYYDVHEYRRLYVPLTSGEHVLPPGRAAYEVDRGWMFAPQSYELVGDTLRLPVRALPDDGRPAAFTGAVGRFTVSARLDRTDLAEGDAATLTVEVEGTGNIKALPAPRLEPVPGVDVFEPTEDATFTARTSGIRGVKRFHWLLVPERSGTLPIPPVAYAWFDPEAERYDSARIELPPLSVRGDVAAATPEDTALARLRTAPEPVPAFAWAGSPWFAWLQLAPLLLIAGALAWRRHPPRLAAQRARRRGREESFTRARRKAGSDPRGALGELQQALDAAVLALTGSDTTDDDALRAHGAGPEVIMSLHAVRAAIRAARFRPDPVKAADVEALIQRAELVLRRIDRVRSARRMAAATSVVALLMLSPAAHADHAQRDAFGEAVAAFERGQFDAARAGFVAHLQSFPLDAAAWYDLGNTDFRLGARGAAIHAWTRALRLQPRADDAAHNLRAIDADHALVFARRPLPFTANELRAFAGFAWLLGGALLALRVAGRSRGARVAGFAGLAGVLLAAVALLGLAGRVGWPDSAVAVRSAAVRGGPALRAEPRATLQEGALARVVDERGEWVHIRAGADEGWVEARDLGRL